MARAIFIALKLAAGFTCLIRRAAQIAGTRIYFGRHVSAVRAPALILLPLFSNTFACGLCGLVAYKAVNPQNGDLPDPVDALQNAAAKVLSHPLAGLENDPAGLKDRYLAGDDALWELKALADRCKGNRAFATIFGSRQAVQKLQQMAHTMDQFIRQESHRLDRAMGQMEARCGEVAVKRLEVLKDVQWCLARELLANLERVAELMKGADPRSVQIFRNLNAVCNSIDRLEVRGRDSAGISLLFIFEDPIFEQLQSLIANQGLMQELDQRTSSTVLGNKGIAIHKSGPDRCAIAFTYKVAAEIGSLGDNVAYLRSQIAGDKILKLAAALPFVFHTISSHTRWASVGAITIANCHPVDNAGSEKKCSSKGIIHACLNGDIDNYLELKKRWEAAGDKIPEEITTDTKIIPLQIEYHLDQGHDFEEAFRLAVNDFEGSHAIAVHSDLAPGKFFLAQKGSGQAVFIGLGQDHYMPTSEVYGFVEETQNYLKLEGEKTIEGENGPVQGQIFILDQTAAGTLDGIRAMYYDGTAIELTAADIQRTEITSRDIDRQDFPHYFLKEISEAPASVEKTLQNRWKIKSAAKPYYLLDLDEKVFPPAIGQALASGQIRRIFFIGQGTAGVAALACANILTHYLRQPGISVSALKASELSGFRLEGGGQGDMQDVLVVAISQSGTTTDTNRTVDMVRGLGAHTLAIVNRRDSDLTFKVDGVIYTSSGRDIEMSVASTKAFYAQIVAGALLGLKIAQVCGSRTESFISNEIRELVSLPAKMQKVLAIKEDIAASARRLALPKTYWAAVGSGPNKAAADEIRIKLSELCYKTISSDYVEDKKHIDLSSEPLIMVCAAGSPPAVMGDIVKDTAIFKAHKAAPIVIADEGEDRFDPYAEDVFHVPATPAHLAPILNTLAGHLWGYYAALAINSGSAFLASFRRQVEEEITACNRRGLDIYEVVLEKSFREKIAEFYATFRKRIASRLMPAGFGRFEDLTLLMKYLSGRLPVSDFELDFGFKGTATNMVRTLFEVLSEAIASMARPVDAIKHQAKTVTVGTSRISEKLEGILFDTLTDYGIGPEQLTNSNVLVIKNLQRIVARIKGAILYRIDGLNVLGEPTDQTTISIVRKAGILSRLPSRVETDPVLKGTKRIIVRRGNVYIGKGRKDDRSILVVPAISTTPGRANQIELLLLLNIGFRQDVDLATKIKALGGKYEHIKNIVQENSILWQDKFLEQVPMEELFGRSAEKVAEMIVSRVGIPEGSA